ncbi:MAG: NADH-quinone oxidoreductase subunit D, partial [Phycisphaerae bacterium]|nr:NADH-quinone oxidoreductase subunit D [Phycisphaerae bacterium]
NVVEPDSIEMIYAMGVERLAGLEVPERAHYVRSIYMELSRVASHLFGLWAYSNMLGFDTVAQWAMYHRDLILDLFEELTGGRVYHIYIWPGGVRRDFPEGFKDKIVKTLHAIGSCVPDYDAVFFNNRLFYDRAHGIGKLSPETARELGATGPILRATGMKYDIRKVEPYAAYDKVPWEVPARQDGDACSRIWVVRDEMIESVHMIFKLLDAMPEGPVYSRTPNPFKWKIPPGETYVRCESSRGELGLYLVSSGEDKPHRVHFRTPSYTHGLTILERVLENASIADVGNTMISLYVVAPEIDR